MDGSAVGCLVSPSDGLAIRKHSVVAVCVWDKLDISRPLSWNNNCWTFPSLTPPHTPYSKLSLDTHTHTYIHTSVYTHGAGHYTGTDGVYSPQAK